MASYEIVVRGGAEGTQELRVIVVDDRERPMGEVAALTANHARLVARDLMALVRQRDPGGAFVLDSQIGPRFGA